MSEGEDTLMEKVYSCYLPGYSPGPVAVVSHCSEFEYVVRKPASLVPVVCGMLHRTPLTFLQQN